MRKTTFAAAAFSLALCLSFSNNAHALLSGGSSCYQVCTTYPGYIANAGRGDLVFRQSSQDDIVTHIMHDMGLTRTHVGMALDAYTVRHNTRNMDNPPTQGFFSKTLDSYFLQYGRTGDGLQNGNAGDFANGFTTTVFNSVNRTNTYAMASRLEQMSRYYGLYAFSQEAAVDATGGNMCSGTIMEASKAAPGAFGILSYDSAQFRTNSAWSVFWDVRNYVEANKYTGIFGADSDGIGTQVVNCFAFQHCNDTSNRNWNATPGAFQYVGTGATVRPDDIVTEVQSAYVMGATFGMGYNYDGNERTAQAVPTTHSCEWICDDSNL